MMNKRFFISLIASTFSTLIFGQIDIPFYGYNWTPGYSIIKKDSTGGIYFYATNDSSKIGYISNMTIYKLFDRNYNIIVEGDLGGRLYVDYYKRFGKWSEYFDNGKIKATGSYYEDHPIGLWQYYFPNGQLQKTYSIDFAEIDDLASYCLTGPYEEFHENGQIKISGYYKTGLDTVTIEQWDVESGESQPVILVQPVSKKFGTWRYFKPNGEIEKKEEYE